MFLTWWCLNLWPRKLWASHCVSLCLSTTSKDLSGPRLECFAIVALASTDAHEHTWVSRIVCQAWRTCLPFSLLRPSACIEQPRCDGGWIVGGAHIKFWSFPASAPAFCLLLFMFVAALCAFEASCCCCWVASCLVVALHWSPSASPPIFVFRILCRRERRSAG